MTDRFDGIEQIGVFARVPGGGHPVCGKSDFADVIDRGSGNVGNGFADRHAPGCRCVYCRKRRPLTHRHGFSANAFETACRDCYVTDGHLPGTDKLVSHTKATDRSITDVYQERFIGHCRESQYAQYGLFEFDPFNIQFLLQARHARNVASRFRRLTEQHFHRHVDAMIAELPVGNHQYPVIGESADYRDRATFTITQARKLVDSFVGNDEDVSLLSLVTPDTHWRHARFGVRHLTQFHPRTQVTMVDGLRHCIRQTARAHVVNKQDRVCFSHCPAPVDDLLGAALDFRIGPLDRGKVQVLVAGAAGEARRSPATQTNQHCRPPDDHQPGADGHINLQRMFFANIAHTAGDHDRLVVAANFVFPWARRFKRAEVTKQVRPAKLIIKGGASNRAVKHDFQRCGHSAGMSEGLFPGLGEAGNTQVRDCKACQPGFRLGAQASRTFIANFSA